MGKQNRGYITRKEAMHNGFYDAYKYELSKSDRDYRGLVIGEYKFIYPVIKNWIDKDSVSPGWLCQNINDKTYIIINNLNAIKMYQQQYNDSSYLGVDYISSELTYTKLNENDFKKEFVEEARKINTTGLDFLEERKRDYINNVKKWIDNLRINISFFKSLEKTEYEHELDRIINKYHFYQVKDISKIKSCLYIAAVDDYNQFYVGKSDGYLKNRMKKHWTAKIIPQRFIYAGGFEYSRIGYDVFKMFDTKRLFVCEDIERLIDENYQESQNNMIGVTNTFGIGTPLEKMTLLDKAERIVINNSKVLYVLSDRIPLPPNPLYKTLHKLKSLTIDNILVKDYLVACVEKSRDYEQ